MRIPGFILFGAFCGSLALADVESRRAEALGKPMESFRTMEGRIYRDVVITKISAGGVSFKHADGAARLRFDELSPGQRNYFGIEEEEAAEVYREEAERREAYERLVAKRVEERRALAEKEAAEREEARQAALVAAAQRNAATANDPSATIPFYPTIKRVDTKVERSRYHRSYYGGAYGYSPFSGTSHHRGWRSGSFYCPTPSLIIRW